MSCYEIKGGRPLFGALAIHGAKNSVLPILAACLLAPGQSVLHNCPDLSDVSACWGVRRSGRVIPSRSTPQPWTAGTSRSV